MIFNLQLKLKRLKLPGQIRGKLKELSEEDEGEGEKNDAYRLEKRWKIAIEAIKEVSMAYKDLKRSLALLASEVAHLE